MAFINPNWQQATWFIDPQNSTGTASDGNSGIDSAHALVTFAELLARWGTTAPMLRNTVTVTFLSSHTDNSDPVIAYPYLINASSFIIQGTPTSTAAVFTLNTAKSRTAGANSLLSGSFSAGAPASGVLVQNTTAGKSSRAFIYKNVGGANWALSQPLVVQALPFASTLPAEVDTWANGDTVNLLTLTRVNVVDVAAVVVDTTGNNGFILSQLNIFDPGAPAVPDFVYFGAGVSIVDGSSNRTVWFGGPQKGTKNTCINSYFLASMQALLRSRGVAGAGSPLITGGIVQSGAAAVTAIVLEAVFDGDVICAGGGTAVFNLRGGTLGFVYLDTTLTCNGGDLSQRAVGYGGSVVYGGAGFTMNMIGSSHYAMLTGGTFTAAFTAPALITGISLNGSATAQSTSGGAINSGIATSVANLDAAAGVAGFGGVAFNLGGAQVTNLS